MTYTQKYFALVILVAPCLASLIILTTLPLFISVPFGIISEVGMLTAGYYLGKRENNVK